MIRRILGRTQNMLVLPSGERRWPLLSSADIEAMLAIAPAIRGYQFVQKESNLIEARLAAPPLTTEQEDQLAGWIESKFSYPFRLRFTYFGELPRTAAGKFEDFLCEVKA